MAKKTDIDEKKTAKARANRCNGYADKVRMMFSQTVNDILAIHKSVPTLEEGQMFSFDAEGTNKQNQVTTLLRKLHSNVVTAIKKGIGIEWNKANDDADKILGELFGNEIKNNPAFVGWLERNESAMSSFIKRTEKGMNLSDMVWKNVKQLREEMEVAMTVSIGEGESASTMSRKVKQCLNDPDLMFRRFRYKKGVDKDGKPIYGRKWKKRVKDEVTGKYKFIDYDKDSYPSGRGVYKSATKNAMRVTRTETNMAYRRADNKRWQNMNFVLGYRIKIAHDHKEKDICDMLQGDYPKEFVFDGWHPQCYCYCTPILMDEEEIIKMMKAKKEGKEYKPKGKEIKDVPANFKKWVEENADKIDKMKEKGTEPYFLRHNKGMVDEILNEKKYENYEENRKLYDKLKADNNYTDVEFDEKTGGLKATHVKHRFDKNKGFYERNVQDIGYKNGYSVLLEKEESSEIGHKFTDGLWDGKKCEIAGAETGTKNNVKKALLHCASKRETEIAIVYFPIIQPSEDIIQEGIAKYIGLLKSGAKGTIRFKKMIFVLSDGRIIKKPL